jgi:DNA primase
MPLIPEDVLDEIQARADLAELIGRYVPLRRAGRHFKALCPFHREKTPSFMVNADKQIFHCFGCGVGGNVFSFLMQQERLTFPEAVRQVAEQVGVRLPEPEPSGHDRARERLATLLERVAQHFEQRLAHPREGAAARKYLAERGVPPEACKTFRLGLAAAGWDGLIKAAATQGVKPEELEAAGLAVLGRSGPYDRFRNRLIFPILDARGRVVGFGGRSLDGREPKYLNSPETALYRKGEHLFGLAQAKEAIATQRAAVVVEGYFDCVVLAGAGVRHVVSPLGTAFTPQQARLLKRYAERVILAFDPDAAGEAAALRGIELLVELGLHVQVARLPQGCDPDALLLRDGREALEGLLAESVGLFDFLIEVAVRRWPPATSERKVQAAQFVLPTVAKVPNAMLRREYVRLLAERLALDEQAVGEELGRVAPRPRVGAGGRQAMPRAGAAALAARGAERMLAALLLEEPSRWDRLAGELTSAAFEDAEAAGVVEQIARARAEGQALTAAQVVSRLAQAGRGASAQGLLALTRGVDSPEAVLEECVRRLREEARARQLRELRRQLQEAQASRDEAGVARLLSTYQRQIREPHRGGEPTHGERIGAQAHS